MVTKLREIITPDQQNTIREYLEKRDQFLRTNFREDIINHSYVIYSRTTGLSLMPTSIEQRWFDNINLEFTEYGKTFKRRLRAHVLRYSFAVHFFKQTNNIFVLSKLLGHKSFTVTEKNLALTEEQSFNESSNLINELWDKQNNNKLSTIEI